MVYGDASPADKRATDDILLQRLMLLMAGESMQPPMLAVLIGRGWLGLRQTTPRHYEAYLTRVGSRELEELRRRSSPR